jgi:MFS transporter, ACS family, hexuronate transporter
MSDSPSLAGPAARGSAWKWWVCGLLLLATTINYMDRLTLSQTSKRVMKELDFQERGYGDLESAFSYAFALGAILMGWMVDRWNVRLLYPAALLVWSAAGFLTGLVNGFFGLLACRFLLGLAEAGHWPCALRTTLHITPPAQRSLGNGILQSGAAIGSVLTPLLILALPKGPDTWRYPFLIVGGVGVCWVLLWLASVRSADLDTPRVAAPPPTGILLLLVALFGVKNLVRWLPDLPSWLPLLVSILVSVAGIAAVFFWLWGRTRDDVTVSRPVFLRRFWVLAVVVVTINGTWQFFRAWLPLILQDTHGYSEDFMNWFNIGYYVAADFGSLAAGAVVLLLVRRGFPVHASRLTVFALAAGLCVLGTAVAFLEAGPLLLGLLLMVGFASLALFPNYYSFTQELTARDQGKVTGALGCMCWLAIAPVQEAVGASAEATGSFAVAITMALCAPLLGVAAIAFYWGKEPGATVQSAHAEPKSQT